MTLPTPTDTPDADAIAVLQDLLALQRQAFRAEPWPSLGARRERLGALAAMMVVHRSRIRVAMTEDFGVHPPLLTDLVEVLGVAARATHAAERLEAWCAPDEGSGDPAALGCASASVRRQPKGVVGNLASWSSPFHLSVGPLAEMLAAGNRVVIKPSGAAPACAALLDEMVRATFDRDLVAVSVGGAELTHVFATLRWDHLLCTGSAATGREVARAAAENLVPVTLELGGACPAVLAEDSVDADTVATVLGTKMVKSGQTRLAVDRVLVPRSRVDDFVALAERFVGEQLPGYASSLDCTGIIDDRELDRLADLLAQARAAGVHVVPLGGVGHPGRRQLPLSLLVDPPSSLRVMTREVSGPLLPVVPYDSVEQAIDHMNEGERPRALYVFAKDAAVAERVLAATGSWTACINACACHGGAVGSGEGPPHGIEGFREFSSARRVLVREPGGASSALLPPYGEQAQSVVDAALGG